MPLIFFITKTIKTTLCCLDNFYFYFSFLCVRYEFLEENYVLISMKMGIMEKEIRENYSNE